MKKKLLERVTVTSLGYGGVWIATHESWKKILIKGALPGSVIDCRILKFHKDYREAQLTHIHSQSPDYTTQEPRCPHFLGNGTSTWVLPLHKVGCGWCRRQFMSYEKQLQLKYDILLDCFSDFFNQYGAVSVYDIVPSPHQYHYRNKIEFSFGKYLQKSRDDASIFSVEEHRNVWFHKQWNYSKILDIDACYLISPRMQGVFAYLKGKLYDSWLPVYDVKTHEGFLRHLVLREGTNTGQCMVILSIASKRYEEYPENKQHRDDFLKQIQADSVFQEQITTAIINTNNGLGDSITGPETKQEVLRWPGYIFEELHLENLKPLRFQISPFSFFQTNTSGAQRLFKTALQAISHLKGNILDLYCGSWTIGLLFKAAGLGKQLMGVEIVESAIDDAYKNARINGIEGVQFFAWKAEQIVTPQLVDDFFQGWDLVIVDPPRSGLHPHVITFLRMLKKRSGCKVLYISCNPITMARDCAMLVDNDIFSLQLLQPVDMFPQTYHLETIGVLS